MENINFWLYGLVALTTIVGFMTTSTSSQSTSRQSKSASKSATGRWLLLTGGEPSAQFQIDFDRLGLGKLVILSAPVTDATSSIGQQDSWSGVIVACPATFPDEHSPMLMNWRMAGTSVYSLADFYEIFGQRLPSAILKDSWLTISQGLQRGIGQMGGKLKRSMDIVAVVILGFFLWPIMLLTIVAIRINSPGPVLYSQVRTGWNGTLFKVYKFRSMYQDAEALGAQWAEARDPRITAVGHWLRVMRIDELPQLWNVLRGEMSLIGPRPERPEFDVTLTAVIPHYELRYLVKPGITGWAQVMYPYGASIEDSYEKLAYDLYYLKNYSIGLDLMIVLKTIRVVLLGKGR
jgi:exopolysaccharide biosynthesis polyprenyl glycosylphosphotransferase